MIPATLVRVLTPSVSPNQKTFKVVLVCCSCDPSPHHLSIFDGFSGSFAFDCSHPSGVPVASLLFLAAFEHVLHLFVFVTSQYPLASVPSPYNLIHNLFSPLNSPQTLYEQDHHEKGQFFGQCNNDQELGHHEEQELVVGASVRIGME